VADKRLVVEKEPAFSIKIYSRDGKDIQGEIKNLGSGAQEKFGNFFELAYILGKYLERINPDLSLENPRSWDNDEGSVDKQGERLFKFMRSLKPF